MSSIQEITGKIHHFEDGEFQHIATIPLPPGRRVIADSGEDWDIVALLHYRKHSRELGIVDDYLPLVLTDTGIDVLQHHEIAGYIGAQKGRR